MAKVGRKWRCSYVAAIESCTLQSFQIIVIWNIFCKNGNPSQICWLQVVRYNLNQLVFIGKFCMHYLVMKLKPEFIYWNGLHLWGLSSISFPWWDFWILQSIKRNLPENPMEIKPIGMGRTTCYNDSLAQIFRHF